MSLKRKSLCSEPEPPNKSLYQRSSKPAKKRRTEEYAETLGVDQKAGTKVKRQVWTPTSIDAFFEGLSQHGKSFHGILHYMQAKFKKKNDPTIPNLTKDQVRFFYYRTWHKVSIMLGECSTDESSRKQLKLGCEELSPPPVNRKFSEQSEDVENPLDSSAEEGDGGELSPRASSPPAPPEQSSPSRLQSNSVEPSINEKGKESAPNPTPATAVDDKIDVKKEVTKDTVVVNGKSHSVDLVALICYHKLRKKCPEQAIGRKLRELVYQGYTTIREKGKRKLQVKIPNCRALRGTMHSIDIPPPADGAYSEPEPLTPSEETRHIVVELRPWSVTSWLYVQGLAQNPRVRLIVAASKPVSEIVQYLAVKWHFKPSDVIHLYHTYSVESAAGSGVALSCQRVPNGSNTGQGAVQESAASSAAKDPDIHVHVQKDMVVGLDLIPPPGPVLEPTHNVPSDLITSGSSQVPSCFTLPAHSAALENVSSLTSVKGVTYRQIDPLSECTVEDLHRKFLKPLKLQLFYEFPNREHACAAETACNLKLATLCKMVEFIGHYEENKVAASSSLAVPVSALNSSVQSSPKRVGYVKLVPKRSPWKSPLSKYQRMKTGSPLKQMSVRRTRLNFSLAPSTYTGGSLQAMSCPQEQVGPLTPTMSTLAVPLLSCSPRTPEAQKGSLQAASSGTVCGTSAEGFSSIKLGNPVLSGAPGSVHQDAATKSGTSVGSFMSLDSIVPQSQCTQEPLEMERSPATTSQGVESPGTTRTTTTPSYHINLTGQSRVIVSPLTLSSPKGPPIDGGRGSPKGPSVLVQPLNRFTEAAVSQSPLLQFATNSLGANFSEKNIANVTTISSQQLPIVTQLKPFSKAKRVKKAPGKAVQTRQLVPRPLSFLSNPPLATVQTPKPVAVAADPVLPVNPLKTNQPSNPPVHVTNLNNPSVSHQVLSLLQSLLQQQMHNSTGSSNQPLQLELSKQQPPVSEHVSRAPVVPAALQENVCKDLGAGAVEKSPSHTANTSDSAEVLNTSSDTVNELLRGLCSHSSDNSLQKLSEETADVLPSFAKAMLSLESTPPSAPSLTEDANLSGLMDQGELLELAGVFSQLKEALQTPEKARQQNPDPDVSISELLNLSDSAPERKLEHSLLSSGDSTFRSLLDDSSVDYIQKFREIASRMNQSS